MNATIQTGRLIETHIYITLFEAVFFAVLVQLFKLIHPPFF